MILRNLLFTLFICLTMSVYSQEHAELPLREIPEAPTDYGPGSMIARSVEGLGFRYYWATEGLRDKDFAYRPTPEARSCGETIDHILGLSRTIYNASLNQANSGNNDEGLTYAEKRKATLEYLDKAAKNYRGKSAKEMEELKIIFQRGENKSEFPFWNMINGPIADALWHSGQVVSFRRSSGNPLPKGVNVFRGTYRP